MSAPGRKISVAKVAKNTDEKSKKVVYQKTILRWPWWRRIRIYKKIAMLMLSDEIGFSRAQTLSQQKIIDLAVAYRLGLKIEEVPESPVSENDESAFMSTMENSLHKQALEAVHIEKMAGNKQASFNLWVGKAVDDYLDTI